MYASIAADDFAFVSRPGNEILDKRVPRGVIYFDLLMVRSRA